MSNKLNDFDKLLKDVLLQEEEMILNYDGISNATTQTLSMEKDDAILKMIYDKNESKIFNIFNGKLNLKMVSKFAAVAACLVLVVGISWGLSNMFSVRSGFDSVKMSAPMESASYDDSYEVSKELSSEPYSTRMARAPEPEMPEAEKKALAVVPNDSSNDPESNIETRSEKIINRFNLEFETKNFQESVDGIIPLVEKYNGFIDNSNISQNGFSKDKVLRYAYFNARIPKDGAANFIEELKKTSGVLFNESQSKDNITSRYADIKRQVDLYNTKEERLMELLTKAEKLEDIITLESQIMDTKSKREAMQSNLNEFDEMVAYDFVDISIREVRDFSKLETPEMNFFDRMNATFKASLTYALIAIQDFLLFIVLNWIFILVIVIVGGLLVYKFKKKKR